LALLFGVFVFAKWGQSAGEAYLTGYVIEKALSVENLFVFYIILNALRVRPEEQHRLLFWGVVGALILRGAMIWGGTVLLARFHWIVYAFGAVLVATGIKMLFGRREAPHPEKSRLYRGLMRVLPTAPGPPGRFFVRDHVWKATPLFTALLLVELSDV